jgi:hypothetical protein
MNTASPVTPDKVLQLGLAFWGSKTLLSAIELGLFTELAKGPADLEQLRTRLGLHQRSARDFFDALVALGVLQRDAAGKYSNTPETAQYLDRNRPEYVGGILEMANARLYPFWGSLTEALKTASPQNEAKGGGDDPFVALYRTPEKLQGFLAAMTGLSLPTANAMSAKFPFAKYKTFADVGCAQGGLPAVVAQKHPHLNGIGYDLPQVQPVFEKYIASFGLQDRLKFQAGNFMEAPMPKVDVIIMGHILHDWDLSVKKMLLKKAYEAIPSGGAVIIHEALIDDDRRQNAFGLLMSLNMLIETPGGFDYTGADCQGWMREAGFRETRVEHLVGPDSMVIGTK